MEAFYTPGLSGRAMARHRGDHAEWSLLRLVELGRTGWGLQHMMEYQGQSEAITPFSMLLE